MISFDGYDGVIKKVYDHHQDHVFQYWGKLHDREKKNLLDDLSGVDFELLEALSLQIDGAAPDISDFEPAPFTPIPRREEEIDEYRAAGDAGRGHIREGRVAAFVVAGGQGSRLGFEGPKGRYPVGPVSGKSLFQIHAEKLLKYSSKYGTAIPWLIMTSQVNHPETVQFLEENDYFGLGKDDVMVFSQNMIPSLDKEGRLLLETRCSLFKNPDGHGGSLAALNTSGALDFLERRGIETISYFQVDNPLVRIIDPVFIGFHVMERASVSSKAVQKDSPDEKVGVFVRFHHKRIGVMEYSDLSEVKKNLRDEAGVLRFSMGNIAIHLFNRDFIREITSGEKMALPYHVARKKIKAYVQGGMREVEGYKFEKFVFDALPLTDRNIVFETLRDEEFAPVKNRSGVDSVETARQLMSDLYRSWLRERNIAIPARVRVIEISPLIAVEPGDLDGSLSVPDQNEVYLSG
jgi:UDP-N-acetylglucosamine/UDP-N-acetylgalactosamine diphosphorylase